MDIILNAKNSNLDQWDSNFSIVINSKCDENVLKAVVNAVINGTGKVRSAWPSSEKFINSWNDTVRISKLGDAFSIEYHQDPGANAETVIAFITELGQSLMALDPDCNMTVDYYVEYNVGGVNMGTVSVREGTLTDEAIDFDLLYDSWCIKQDDEDEYDDDEEYLDIPCEDMECFDIDEMMARCDAAGAEYKSVENVIRYPDFKLEWTADGLADVLAAAENSEENFDTDAITKMCGK